MAISTTIPGFVIRPASEADVAVILCDRHGAGKIGRGINDSPERMPGSARAGFATDQAPAAL